MDVNTTYTEIQALELLIYAINKREKSAIAELNRLHKLVYGETVTAGCSNCHIKAFKKLLSLTKQDLENMENQNFKINKDSLIEYPARSGEFYSSANGIEDAKAVELLKEYPQLVSHFDIYPGHEDGKLDLSKVKGSKKVTEPKDK